MGKTRPQSTVSQQLRTESLWPVPSWRLLMLVSLFTCIHGPEVGCLGDKRGSREETLISVQMTQAASPPWLTWTFLVQIGVSSASDNILILQPIR